MTFHVGLTGQDECLDGPVGGAELCGENEIKHLRASSHAPALDAAVHSVRVFREEFREFIRTTSGSTNLPAGHPMIVRINDLLKCGRQQLKIAFGQGDHHDQSSSTRSATLKTTHEYRSPDDLLLRIAAACAHLICEADFRYVRNCEGPTCTMYFLDVSKNHKRRWCSMDVCGNRAKAAAHRKR